MNSYFKEAYVIISFFAFTACGTQQADEPIDFTAALQTAYNAQLDSLITVMEDFGQLQETERLQLQFVTARMRFKQLEPVLGFFKSSVYKALNMPNLMIVHEGDNGKENELPQGFQVLEEALFAENPDPAAVNREIQNITGTLKLERSNSLLPNAKDYHFLWMMRASLMRIMSLGITGFDSPVTLNSMEENAVALEACADYLEVYRKRFSSEQLFKEYELALKDAAVSLKGKDFEKFDRYGFIKSHVHPLLVLWKRTVADWNVEFPLKSKVNYDAESFFTNATFNIDKFSVRNSAAFTPEVISLGKALFYDASLSKSGKMSCASCHQPERYFTDGLIRSRGNDGRDLLRNSPTLLYAALQTSQFYDARVVNLEHQIIDVVNNEQEFHSDLSNMTATVMANERYKAGFDSLYQAGVNSRTIRNAMGHYIRTLTPFNSKFDRNINDLEQSLTDKEIKGFNLFMGKAACGTCHFAPVFNGTVPPEFSHTELEVIGVPSKADWENAQIDPDAGRYALYLASQRKFAFKTSTVRNASQTAPYMHNGVYKTLEEVLRFYNMGGGAGIDIDLPNQTLPPDPLGLTDDEIDAIVVFIKTLEDDLSNYDLTGL